MIAKENLRGLQWPTLSRHHVDRNRGLRDIDGQFEQFAVDLGSAPQRVLNTHSSDQIAHLFADPWPATARARFPSPVRGEAHSMPTHNSLGPDDGYRVTETLEHGRPSLHNAAAAGARVRQAAQHRGSKPSRWHDYRRCALASGSAWQVLFAKWGLHSEIPPALLPGRRKGPRRPLRRWRATFFAGWLPSTSSKLLI